MSEYLGKAIGTGLLLVGCMIASKTGLIGGKTYADPHKPIEIFTAWHKDACACVDMACAETQSTRLDDLIEQNPLYEGYVYNAAQSHVDAGNACLSKLIAAAQEREAKPAKRATKSKKSRK